MAAPSSDANRNSSLDWLLEAAQPDDFALAWANTRSLLDEFPFNIVIKDTAGRRVYANKAYLTLHRKSLAEVQGKTDFDLFPHDLAQKFTTDDQTVMKTGRSSRAMEKHGSEELEQVWIERIKIPLRGVHDEIVGIVVVFWDVSLLNQTQEALQHERSLMHALMENIPDAIYFKDRESRFLRISSAQAEKFNIETADDAIGLTDADIFTAEHAQQALQDEARIMRTGQPMVARLEKETWKDREDTWVSTTKMPLRDSSGAIVGTFGISRDVSELKRAQDQLQLARDAADSANRAKSDFLANMSHEIRTPMNAIIGMTELLLDTSLTPSQREYLTIVQESGESLLSLLNDILDFSKIEAGHMELDAVPFDIHHSIGNTLRSLAMRAHAKGLELAYSIDPVIPTTLVGDIGRLRQIIVNLIGNAIKFTAEGEVVLHGTLLKALDDGVLLEFTVRDTGIGIRKEKQRQIFDAFQQADTSTTRDFGGTGLGLAICSRLVALMNGEISVDSEPDQGSTFRFTAKFRVNQDQTEQASTETSLVGSRVLIVDDNQTNRRILHDMLGNWGLKPTVACSAVEAIHQLNSAYEDGAPLQAVILDVNMPGQSGFDLAAWIRGDQRFKQLPLLMLTSGGRPGDAIRRQQLNIAANMLKPAKQSEIFESLLAVLGSTQRGTSPSYELPSEILTFPGTKILLAEDNIVNQKLAVGILRKLQCQTVVACHGREAIEAWEHGNHDLILMDIQMPECDGMQATRTIRARELPGEHIPIIAMTAHAMTGDREKCLESGMDDYLSKPVRITELAAMLAKYVKGQSAASKDTNPKTANSLMDWDEALAGAAGDRELLQSVVDAFLQECPVLLNETVTAISNQDTEQLRRAAHTLKGALLSIAARPVAETALSLEESAREADFVNAQNLLTTLQSQLKDLAKVIQEGS